MLRATLAIYLMLVTAAGPNLCCCTLLHAFAARAETSAPSPAAPSCCHTASTPTTCSHEQGTPHKSTCPCRDDAPKTAIVDRAIESPAPMLGASLPATYLASTFDAALAVKGGAALPGGEPPSLTAHDMLCLHHQLRC